MKMKVLLLKYSGGTGGIMSWLLVHADELQRQGIDCDFWFCFGGQRFKEFERRGARVGTVTELVKELERGAYDVVHIINDDPLGDLIPLLRPAPKLVVTSQGRLAEWKGGDCFAYTAVSRGTAALNQCLTNLEVEYIPNAVDCEKFTPPPAFSSGRPIIAWAGRTTDVQKDFPRFTRIAASLADKGFRFWVADAHGAAWDSFRADPSCREIPIERWERVPHQEMPQFYRDIAASGGALLMTSRLEGLSMVVIEAGACGAGTIAPAVTGLQECVIGGASGMLFKPDASDAEVAEVVLRWLALGTPESRIESCAQAIRHEFSGERMTRKYLDIYHRREQRFFHGESSPWKVDESGMADLLVRFNPSRWRRANSLRKMARQLAIEKKGVALRALYRSARVRLRSCARPGILADILKTAALIAVRRSSVDGGAAPRQAVSGS
jgi:glycosyltransferase involved in cell wall biosynthesis